MELIQQFGIDPLLLSAQIINFLIIAYLLKRFMYKPVLDMLKSREQTIKKGLKDSDEAAKLLSLTEEKEKDILRKAQTEAKNIIETARKEQKELVRLTEEQTRKQAESILTEARAQITFEMQETEKKLAANISHLAVEFLQKSISGIFSEKEQNAIMAQAVKELKKEKN